MKRLRLCPLLVLVLTGVVVSAQEVVLRVDAGQDLGPISPYVYGANYAAGVVPPDLMPQAVATSINFLQLGANYIEEMGVPTLQIDMVMLLAGQLNADVTIAVPVYNGSPEKALETLQYTKDKGYHVRYWTIGDEPNLFKDYTTDEYNADWRAIAETLEAADPDILFIGPDLSQYPPDPDKTPRDKDGHEWLREFLVANGDMVDVVSVHRFPFPVVRNDPPTTIDQLHANAQEWDSIIPNVRAVIQETTGRDLPIAINGFTSHYTNAIGGEATPDSFYHAIWLADVLGRMIRQKVFMASYFDLQSSVSRGGSGLLSRYDVRPSYYTYVLYSHFGSELVESSSSDPDTSIYAALTDDGALTLMVVNLGSGEKTLTLQLDDFSLSGPAEVWRFDADHNAEHIDSLDLNGTFTAPGQSITLYIVPGG